MSDRTFTNLAPAPLWPSALARLTRSRLTRSVSRSAPPAPRMQRSALADFGGTPERHGAPRGRGLAVMLRIAWRRYRSRHCLAELDAHLLKDIGVTYAEAEAEANKPFWLA